MGGNPTQGDLYPFEFLSRRNSMFVFLFLGSFDIYCFFPSPYFFQCFFPYRFFFFSLARSFRLILSLAFRLHTESSLGQQRLIYHCCWARSSPSYVLRTLETRSINPLWSMVSRSSRLIHAVGYAYLRPTKYSDEHHTR